MTSEPRKRRAGWVWAVAGVVGVTAAVPLAFALSAYYVADGIDAGRFPPDAMWPYGRVRTLLGDGPAGRLWSDWLDWCREHPFD